MSSKVKVSKHKQHHDDATEALLERLPLDERGRVSWRRLAADLGITDEIAQRLF